MFSALRPRWQSQFSSLAWPLVLSATQVWKPEMILAGPPPSLKPLGRVSGSNRGTELEPDSARVALLRGFGVDMKACKGLWFVA